MKKTPLLFLLLLMTPIAQANEYLLSICNEDSYVQHRGEKLYLPNKSEPYSGLSWCRTEAQVDVSKGNYKNGLKEGLWETWYPDGRLTYAIEYKAGEFDGKRQHYYESGGKENRSYWKNGVRSGSHEEWFENGQIRKREHYKDGNVDAEFKDWFENGQIKNHGYRVNGEIDGVYTRWYEHSGGVKAEHTEYKDGKYNGRLLGWDEITGNIISDCNYLDGKKHGECILYMDPLYLFPVQNVFYSAGEIVEYHIYDEENKLEQYMNKIGGTRNGVWYWSHKNLDSLVERDGEVVLEITDAEKDILKNTGIFIFPKERATYKKKDLYIFERADGQVETIVYYDDSYIPKPAISLLKRALTEVKRISDLEKAQADKEELSRAAAEIVISDSAAQEESPDNTDDLKEK